MRCHQRRRRIQNSGSAPHEHVDVEESVLDPVKGLENVEPYEGHVVGAKEPSRAGWHEKLRGDSEAAPRLDHGRVRILGPPGYDGDRARDT